MAEGGVTRQDIEKMLWMQSGWQIEQEQVDAILAKVDQYAAGNGSVLHVDAATFETVQRAATFGDLPEDEQRQWQRKALVRMLDAIRRGQELGRQDLERAVERARADGYQAGLAVERAESPESPSAGSERAAVEIAPGQAVQAEDGTLWLHLGAHQLLTAPTVGRDVHTRMCRICMKIQDIGAYRKEAKSPGGYRTACTPCENSGRSGRR